MAPASIDYRLLFVLAATILAWGCKSSDSGSVSAWSATPAQAVTVGDWDDVHAAALVAVGQHETAIVSYQETSSTEQVFRLRTINDQPGTLIARRDSPAPKASGPAPIHLSCSIGLFGDDRLERAILQSMRRRLDSLAGVDFAPIR